MTVRYRGAVRYKAEAQHAKADSLAALRKITVYC